MHHEETPLSAARRAEIRAIMSLVNDAISAAREDLDKLDGLDEKSMTQPVTEVALEALSDLQRAATQITDSAETLAVYLVTERGVSRAKVAQALGVTPVTVWRWVQNSKETETE